MNESDRNHLRDWVDDHLEAYVDGELPAEKRRRVEAFIRKDEEAARRLMLARRVREALSAVDRPACPSEVTHAVLGVAASSDRFRTHPRTAPRTPLHDRPSVPADQTVRAARRRLSVSVGRRLGPAWSSYLRPSLITAAFVLIVVASALIARAPHESAPSATASAAPSATASAAPSATASAAPSATASAAPSATLSATPSAETPSAQTATPAEVDQALQEAKWALAYISNVGRRTGQSIRQEVLEERVTEPVQRALETGLGTALGTEPNG